MIWLNVGDRNVVMLRCCRMGGHIMPFTEEQFFQVFATYNAAIHPSLRSLSSSGLQRSVFYSGGLGSPRYRSWRSSR